MEQIEKIVSDREIIKEKLREHFDGKIVRKDLTKHIKEGLNVPVYVLEFLLGQYCSSDDQEVIDKGVETVKKILADNYVRPDEAQKILSVLRKRGAYTVIDKITVSLNIKKDIYEAEFSNLGLKALQIEDEYPEKYDRLLCGGIWCIVQLEYGGDDQFADMDQDLKKKTTDDFPIRIRKLTPIQMPHVDINDLKKINDVHGHKAGDQYIKGCCHLLCETFKHSPVFRIGGDEFVAILQGPDFENKQSLLERLRNDLNESYSNEDLDPWLRYSAAVGMADLASDDNTFELVFKRADQAMYEDKKRFKEQHGSYR